MTGISQVEKDKIKALNEDEKVIFHSSFSDVHFDFISRLAENQFAMKVEIVRKMIADIYIADSFSSEVVGNLDMQVSGVNDVHKMKLSLPKSLDAYLTQKSEENMISKTSVLRQIVQYHYNKMTQEAKEK